jgi:hypothetical protein
MAWDPRGYLVCRRRCGGYLLAPTPGSGPTPCAFRCGSFASWWCELCRAEVCRDHAIAREDGTFLCERCAAEARRATEAQERRVSGERRRQLAEAVAAVSTCTDAHQLLEAVTSHVDQPIAEECRDAWIRVVVGKVAPNHEIAHFASRGLRRRWEETEPRHPAWLAAGLQGAPDMILDAAGGLWLSPPAERLEGAEATLVLRPSRPLELVGRGNDQHVTNARQRLRTGEPPVYARAVKAALEYALR